MAPEFLEFQNLSQINHLSPADPFQTSKYRKFRQFFAETRLNNPLVTGRGEICYDK